VREPRIKFESCGWEREGFGIEYSRGYGFLVGGVVAMASLSSLASRHGGLCNWFGAMKKIITESPAFWFSESRQRVPIDIDSQSALSLASSQSIHRHDRGRSQR
jgi:hypothetical protein